jgi:hypothetical protein
MFHNYMWQGRILEVREDRGFIDNEIRNSNFGNTAQGHGINPIKTPQPSNVQVNNQSYGNMYAIQVSGANLNNNFHFSRHVLIFE